MRILLTGGSGSGKSTYAERLCRALPAPRYYVATMRPYDGECLLKIRRHRVQRESADFTTIERQEDVGGLVFPARGTVLLECMCNLLANEMFDEVGNKRDVFEKILMDLATLEKACETLIVVTNEVGSDGGVYAENTAFYIETLGRINRALAERFDLVVELVCGIPLARKGELPVL
ncbi:MAG: bifunctional adenosylcobinamide kinase/adenosylcobinamide-phosphate guanylyltransferase [Eubacteriales bacterium]|nr:bifunctional adenosylcobinamide kinase/adenosylcobinamide-phosphate guanylyltransferase [Eubacteriales bacterium]